ncbi:MAG TPA: hypothetical protein VHQ88_08990 [Burkholderiales bacterium]|jgi:hypothetical protein|nr:hypothetical protein [Burkholderiales bacterium]
MLQPFKAWKPPKDFETLCALSINEEKSRICKVTAPRRGVHPYFAYIEMVAFQLNRITAGVGKNFS